MAGKRDIGCVLIIGMLVLWGCSKKEDAFVRSDDATPSASGAIEESTGQPEHAPNQEVQAITVDKVLGVWEKGRKSEAVRLFLDIDWNRQDLFVSNSIFGLSEAEFVKFPEPQRLDIQQKALDTSATIREISKYMVEQAKQQGQEFVTYRNSLLACGKRLSRDDQLLLVQKLGEAILGYVGKELPAR